MNFEKVIFLHIAKTGGTSLVEYFRQRLPQDAVLSHGDFISVNDNPPLRADLVARNKFVSGHFGFDYINDYLSDAYSFTFLRDPVARVLSFYKFCMHKDMQNRFAVARAAGDLGINGFLVSMLDAVVEVVDNQQTWQLASMYRICDRQEGRFNCDDAVLEKAKENLARLSYVGFTESFDTCFKQIIDDVGLENPAKVPHEFRTRDPVDEEDLDSAVLARLRERLSLDVELYEHARRAFPVVSQ